MFSCTQFYTTNEIFQYVPKGETTEQKDILQIEHSQAMESSAKPENSSFGLGEVIQLGENINDENATSLEPQPLASSEAVEAKQRKQGALHNLASKFARALGVSEIGA